MAHECNDRYDDGFAAGKAKGMAEVLRMLDAGHVEGCACEPCNVVQTIQVRATCEGHPLVEVRFVKSVIGEDGSVIPPESVG